MQEILLNPKSRIRLTWISIASIVFFYSVFQPFQMSQYNINDYIIVNVAYLIISGIVISFHLVVFPLYFNHQFLQYISLRHGRRLFFIWMILILGISFFLFKISFGYYDFTIERVITGLLSVGALAIFPLLALSLIDRKAEEIKNFEETLIYTSAGKINIEDVLYIYSDKNYVIWVDLSGNEIKIRGTLKSVRDQLRNNDSFIQTHRAFLVNLSKINNVTKENNAYSISINEHDKNIPLSRSFYSSFQKAFYP